MTQKTEHYNLLVEDWIPVLWSDGKYSRVGIIEALTKAAQIRQVAAPNPMDSLSLLRLLNVIMHWSKQTISSCEMNTLHRAVGIPEDWLEENVGNEKRPAHFFNLMGEGPRFFQDMTQAKENPNRPASALFPYLPSGTEINHFRHVFDDTIFLCQACCALGLARLPACTTQGGQGLTPSINNAPPIYFVPMGKSLLETLLLNWPLEEIVSDDVPSWENDPSSQEKVGLLEGFTWLPRSVWLGKIHWHEQKKCSRCGAAGPFISELSSRKGGVARAIPENG